MNAVRSVRDEVGAIDVPMLEVYNKCDALTPDDDFGGVLLVAQPHADPVPALRELARGARLPGDHK